VEDIMALHGLTRKTTAAAAAVGLGALLLAACAPDSRAQFFGATANTAAPMAVTCEPNQRAIVRQVPVNGVMTPQVECQSAAGFAGAMPAAYQPAGYQPAGPGLVPANYTTSAYQPYDNTRVVRTSYPVREVAPRRAAYQRAPERVVRSGRTWQKSALIIGSSAGIGAGLGAAIHGKKGALIGAALGGGGATIWDQMTRHKQ
jgi:hypothetical protein